MTTSVISQSVAIDLQHEMALRTDPLAPSEHITRYHDREIRIVVIPSARRRQPTGGLRLVVDGPRPAWATAYRTYRREARVSPGYTARQFVGAVDRLMRWACLEVERIQHVETVYRAEQRSNMSDAMRDAVMAEERRLGRTSAYDTMSIEDAQHWDRWIGEWWRAHPEDRKSA
jgi:hypothetical protein